MAHKARFLRHAGKEERFSSQGESLTAGKGQEKRVYKKGGGGVGGYWSQGSRNRRNAGYRGDYRMKSNDRKVAEIKCLRGEQTTKESTKNKGKEKSSQWFLMGVLQGSGGEDEEKGHMTKKKEGCGGRRLYGGH